MTSLRVTSTQSRCPPRLAGAGRLHGEKVVEKHSVAAKVPAPASVVHVRRQRSIAGTAVALHGDMEALSTLAALHAVEGHVSQGFEHVRETFADNFTRRKELGGACCAYR